MNINELRQLVQEEMSRFEFMKHLAGKHPDLNAKQIGGIYKLYKDGMDIDAAVSQVAGVEEVEAPAATAQEPTKLQKLGKSSTGAVRTGSETGSFAAALEKTKEQLASQKPEQQIKSIATLLNKLGVTKEQLILLVRKS